MIEDAAAAAAGEPEQPPPSQPPPSEPPPTPPFTGAELLDLIATAKATVAFVVVELGGGSREDGERLATMRPGLQRIVESLADNAAQALPGEIRGAMSPKTALIGLCAVIALDTFATLRVIDRERKARAQADAAKAPPPPPGAPPRVVPVVGREDMPPAQ